MKECWNNGIMDSKSERNNIYSILLPLLQFVLEELHHHSTIPIFPGPDLACKG
jgi:hypothetical protein